MISDNLPALETKIRNELARKPESFIVHPSELAILRDMTSAEIEDFAHRNGWRTVCRLGGRQYQFYNDTFERMLNDGYDPTGGSAIAPVR